MYFAVYPFFCTTIPQSLRSLRKFLVQVLKILVPSSFRPVLSFCLHLFDYSDFGCGSAALCSLCPFAAKNAWLSTRLRGHFCRLDQLPELRILLQRLILLHL